MKLLKLMSAVSAGIIGATLMAASASAQTPEVFVDGHMIHFEEQDPIIINDVTMIPARSVFRAMNCKVQWLGEKRQVQIDSADNMTRVLFTIDDPQMKVYHFQNMWHADETIVDLESAPQILNDKTVIPMRAVAEAMGATVDWNGQTFTIDIRTDAPVPSQDAARFYLSADKEDVSTGDELTVYLNADQLTQYEGAGIANASVAIYYDPSKLKLTSTSILDENGEAVKGMDAFNGTFFDDMLKTVNVLTDFNNLPMFDGKIVKLTFDALADEGGELSISDGYMASRGYDTVVGMLDESGLWELNPTNAVFSTEPIVIK
ncbi:MAG: stalk domain-containing protein [Clostridiales bacterium]|nr:stalk domain-containing protein [Clostridiales bacterium]